MKYLLESELQLLCKNNHSLIHNCKGGGGGGSSGAVSYPGYMETIHQDWLEGAAASRLTTENVTATMAAAIGNSPFTTYSAYNPDTDIAAMEVALATFTNLVAAIDPGTDVVGFLQAIKNEIDNNWTSDEAIQDAVDAFGAILDDQIDNEVLPEFEIGMRDANAVMSSAFVLGKAYIYASRDRDVAKYAGDLKMVSRKDVLLAGLQGMIHIEEVKIANTASVSASTIEQKRIKIVAKNEENDIDMKIDENDASWDLEVFQYGANVLASIGGGAVTPKGSGSKTNKMQSAIGGALSGAASGAMIGAAKGSVGGPWGAAIGGAIGLAGGLL